MAVVKSLVVAGIVAVGVQVVDAAVELEVPSNYDTKTADIPAPFSKEEGYLFSSSVGNTQEREPVKHSSGYWPCLRVPKGLDERYPTWETGGWMNSNKFCDFSKQPGKSMYSCRGMYTLYKTKKFPQFPAPHCFAYNISFPLDKEYVSSIDTIQNQGELCTNYIEKGRAVTPAAIYTPISDEWVAHRSTLGCPSDVWSFSEGGKNTFCNQVTGIDWMQICDYAKEAETRPVMHACWDVCSDTLARCTLATKFGMGSLLSSQNYEPADYVKEMNPHETIDAWCMFLSQDSVCLGMDYYYPDGKMTENSCYPDGVNSMEVVKGLPADHPFAGTKGNFFRSDGKKMSDVTVAPEGKDKVPSEAQGKVDTAKAAALAKRDTMMKGITDIDQKMKAKLLADVSESGKKVQKVAAKVEAAKAGAACEKITGKLNKVTIEYPDKYPVWCEAKKSSSRRSLLVELLDYDTITYASPEMNITKAKKALADAGITATFTESDPIEELMKVDGIDTSAVKEFETAAKATVAAQKAAEEAKKTTPTESAAVGRAVISAFAVVIAALLA